MSRETMETLNRFVLVGDCDHRPMAWHNDPELRRRKGWADNHFPGFIPMEEVIARLFNWEAEAVPKANMIPCAKKDANFFGPQGQPYKIVPTGSWRKIGHDDDDYEGYQFVGVEQGIVRSDTHAHLATHGGGYKIHDYKEWLLGLQAEVIGQDLSILGAGLLRNGLQAYVQVALPETVHDKTSGMRFIPFMMISTSLDGSMPTNATRQFLRVVCDNTRDRALGEAARNGCLFTAKHTARSLDWERVEELRNALGILVESAKDLIKEERELVAQPVTRRQFIKIMDIIMPLPKAADNPSQQAITRRKNQRDKVIDTYTKDPMCADLQNTAAGVLHTFNTYFHHYRQVNGDSTARFQKNTDLVLRGKIGENDRKVANAMAVVLDRPEWASANN